VEESIARRERPAHLICRSGWAVIATAACGYCAYISYVSVRNDDFLWQHQLWNIVTWAVWTALATGLITETRCRRERVLFALLLWVFVIGLVFSLWAGAPFATVRGARIMATALWGLAAFISLVAIFSPAKRGPAENGRDSIGKR
jgi:FtsH-binding integral membrane protein